MKLRPRFASPVWLAGIVIALALGRPDAPGGIAAAQAQAPASTELPPRLRDTGLYAGPATNAVGPDTVAFSPQYPLWSDGSTKRRWLRLPPGTFIDASQADAWVFPPGTRLWKEFSQGGRPVETRYIERAADGDWRFATYVWNADASDALLAPQRGIAALPVAAAPGGRYVIPGRGDCLACHASGAVPVLGASALQLSPERDPLAPHAAPAGQDEIDLSGLVARGFVRHLAPALLETPPRIAAATPLERAALGYLHANCGNCHNASESRAPVRLILSQSVAAPAAGRADMLRSSVDAPSRYRPAEVAGMAWVIASGQAAQSVLTLRMASRDPQMQMPPLGSQVADAQGLALLRRWIDHELPTPQEHMP